MKWKFRQTALQFYEVYQFHLPVRSPTTGNDEVVLLVLVVVLVDAVHHQVLDHVGRRRHPRAWPGRPRHDGARAGHRGAQQRR